MFDPSQAIAQLVREDTRYPFEAYVFIFEALNYAQNALGMGADTPSEAAEEDPQKTEHHVTGQELCEAIRCYALEQYGYMAQTVLNNWNIRKTSDFGELVFNLIRAGQMRKTPSDTRVDFDDVYDFDSAFRQSFKITLPEK